MGEYDVRCHSGYCQPFAACQLEWLPVVCIFAFGAHFMSCHKIFRTRFIFNGLSFFFEFDVLSVQSRRKCAICASLVGQEWALAAVRRPRRFSFLQKQLQCVCPRRFVNRHSRMALFTSIGQPRYMFCCAQANIRAMLYALAESVHILTINDVH